MYSIKFKQHDQDNINYYDFTTRQDWEKEFGDYYNFDEVWSAPQTQGDYNISAPADIRSFCDGSDNTAPYFSSLSARQEWESVVDSYDVSYDESTTEIDLSNAESSGW